MKTAIYVADGLWEVAGDLYPTDGASALVQRGLRSLVREWAGTPELQAALDRLGEEARDDIAASIFTRADDE